MRAKYPLTRLRDNPYDRLLFNTLSIIICNISTGKKKHCSSGWSRGSYGWSRGSPGWTRGSPVWSRGPSGWSRGSSVCCCGPFCWSCDSSWCYLIHMKIREKTIQTYIMFSHTFGKVAHNYSWDIFMVVTIRTYNNSELWTLS